MGRYSLQGAVVFEGKGDDAAVGAARGENCWRELDLTDERCVAL